MSEAPIPAAEAKRLDALQALHVMHTLPERVYDDVVRVAARLLGAPMGMLSFVGREEQWWKAAVGIEGDGTARRDAFCAHAILTPGEVTVIPDAAADPRFQDNPLVTGGPAIRFYAGAPLLAGHGEAVGALCVADHAPRELSAEDAETLQALARVVMTLLEDRRTIEGFEARALGQQQSMQKELDASRRELAAAYARLEAETVTDAVTGLYNARAFHQRLDEEIARARRIELPLSLLMLDLDHLPQYAATFGAAATDEALATTATILATCARANDVLFRVGPHEFAILTPATPPEGAMILAQRIRRTAAGYAWPRRALTVSIGVAALGNKLPNRAELVQAARQALGEARSGGRNQAVLY